MRSARPSTNLVYKYFNVMYEKRTLKILKEIPLNGADSLPLGHSSYYAYNENLNIGAAAFLNGKCIKPLTSRVVVNSLDHESIKTLRNKDWKNILNNTFSAITKKVGETHSGASLCVGLFIGNQLHIANIGINYIYQVIISDKKELQVKLLNAGMLHTPTLETKRLAMFATNHKKNFELLVPKECLDPSQNGRLAGQLKLSRAIGYTNYESDGLIHAPDTKHIDLSIPCNSKSFIIIASPSLVAHLTQPEDAIGTFIKKHLNDTADNIAKAFAVNFQNNLLPNKNNGVCVIPIHADAKPTDAKYVALISNHGGNSVGDVVCQHFHALLHEQINNISCFSNSIHTNFRQRSHTYPTPKPSLLPSVMPSC